MIRRVCGVALACGVLVGVVGQPPMVAAAAPSSTQAITGKVATVSVWQPVTTLAVPEGTNYVAFDVIGGGGGSGKAREDASPGMGGQGAEVTGTTRISSLDPKAALILAPGGGGRLGQGGTAILGRNGGGGQSSGGGGGGASTLTYINGDKTRYDIAVAGGGGGGADGYRGYKNFNSLHWDCAGGSGGDAGKSPGDGHPSESSPYCEAKQGGHGPRTDGGGEGSRMDSRGLGVFSGAGGGGWDGHAGGGGGQGAAADETQDERLKGAGGGGSAGASWTASDVISPVVTTAHRAPGGNQGADGQVTVFFYHADAPADITTISDQDGKQIDVPGASTQPGQKVHVVDANTTGAQKWAWVPSKNKQYQLVNMTSGLCLGLDGNGRDVVQQVCKADSDAGVTAQLWHKETGSDNDKDPGMITTADGSHLNSNGGELHIEPRNSGVRATTWTTTANQ